MVSTENIYKDFANFSKYKTITIIPNIYKIFGSEISKRIPKIYIYMHRTFTLKNSVELYQKLNQILDDQLTMNYITQSIKNYFDIKKMPKYNKHIEAQLRHKVDAEVIWKRKPTSAWWRCRSCMEKKTNFGMMEMPKLYGKENQLRHDGDAEVV